MGMRTLLPEVKIGNVYEWGVSTSGEVSSSEDRKLEYKVGIKSVNIEWEHKVGIKILEYKVEI